MIDLEFGDTRIQVSEPSVLRVSRPTAPHLLLVTGMRQSTALTKAFQEECAELGASSTSIGFECIDPIMQVDRYSLGLPRAVIEDEILRDVPERMLLRGLVCNALSNYIGRLDFVVGHSSGCNELVVARRLSGDATTLPAKGILFEPPLMERKPGDRATIARKVTLAYIAQERLAQENPSLVVSPQSLVGENAYASADAIKNNRASIQDIAYGRGMTLWKDARRKGMDWPIVVSKGDHIASAEELVPAAKPYGKQIQYYPDFGRPTGHGEFFTQMHHTAAFIIAAAQNIIPEQKLTA